MMNDTGQLCTVQQDIEKIMSGYYDTKEEVRKALFDMHPSKAPGLDGFNAPFLPR